MLFYNLPKVWPYRFLQFATKNRFFSFLAFNELVKCGTQIEASGNNIETGLAVIAAINEDEKTTAVMLSNFDDETSNVVLDMNKPSDKRYGLLLGIPA